MKKIIPLIIGVAVTATGWLLWDNNEGSSLKGKEGYYKELCEKGVKTTALLHNEYTQTKGKVLSAVTYKYDYEVNGKKYTGEITTDKLPESLSIEVTYLPGKPEVSEKGDPCKTYESIKNSTGSSSLMYVGEGMFFIGIIFTYSRLKNQVRGGQTDK